MLRRLGIRGKVFAALSVPVLVLFVMAGALSLQSVQEAQTARSVTTLLTALQQSRYMAVELRAERRAAMALVQGTIDDPAEVQAARDDVDAVAANLTRLLAQVDTGDLNPRVEAEVERVQSTIRNLGRLRNRLDTTSPPVQVVMREYTGIVGEVIAFPQLVGDALEDRQLGAILSAHALVMSAVDHYSQEAALGSELLQAGGEPAEALMVQVAALFPTSDLVHRNAEAAVAALGLDDVVVPPLGASATGFQSFQSYRTVIQGGSRQALEFSREEDFTIAANAEIDNFDDVLDGLRIAAVTRADATASSAVRTAILTIGISLAAVVVSIITALAISRQIVRPLRRLTEAAGTVRDELPHLVEQVAIPGQGPDLRLTRIPVDSRDEIGRLATAFNEVNETTIEVAQEQAALRASIAEMFINVARRDQVLLNRQLSFIDALERSEEDPKTLADLFRLDHLATRMRRNAESLLVLAGIDTGRRLRETLPTSDVIRTASSEIEHYERIQLDLPVDPLMLGHTALPAAHMLAELLENATTFSDPGTPVHVATGIDEEHVIITIADQGLGMTPDELAAANLKIQTTSAGDVLGAQRLGLYVVGRIATRLGLNVELGTGPEGRGTLVTVRMPLVLFVDPTSVPLAGPGEGGRVETFVAPEEAAVVVHDAAFAPAPEEAPDVPAGAYGSAENPAEAVDIDSLIEGTTEQGLPKRRSRGGDAPEWDMSGGDSAAAPAVPLAPTPEALAQAAQGTSTTAAWQPPVVQTSVPLSPRRPVDGADGEPAGDATASGEGDALPTRTPTRNASGLPMRGAAGTQPPVPLSAVGGPTASGLPSRQRSGAGVPTAPDAVDPTSATGPQNVEGRTAMFQGFRSRRAELAAAAIQEAGDEDAASDSADAVERLAAAATGAAAFFQRDDAGRFTGDDGERFTGDDGATTEDAVAVPPLVDDEEDFGDPAFAPEAPAAQLAPEAPAAQLARDATRLAPDATQPGAEPAQPISADAGASWPPAAESWPPAVEPSTAPVEPWAAAAPAEQVATASAWPPQPPAAQPAVSSAPDALPEPPAAQVPDGFAPVPMASGHAGAEAPSPYGPHGSSVDFAELVQGPTRRSIREAHETKPRRWFRRSRGRAVEPSAPTVAAPIPAPPAAEPAAPPVFVPDVPAPAPAPESPVRQSAWGAQTAGTHAVPASAEPGLPEAPTTQREPVSRAPEAAPVAEAPPSVGLWTPQPGWDDQHGASSGHALGAAWPGKPELRQPREAWPHTEVPAPAAPPAPETVTPPPAPAAPVVPPAPVVPAVPAGHAGQTTFTPQPMFGFDDEMTNMLAQRADIAQQALAELNQLSMYRPQAVAGTGSAALTRRTPGTIPAAPEIATSSTTPRPARDANQVRSLLSSFQTGTTRGRDLAGGGTDATSPSTGENGRAGGEEGPVDHGEPVTTPDADQNSRDTTW